MKKSSREKIVNDDGLSHNLPWSHEKFTFQFLEKLFASSSFYSPVIHPTVEDQVALAQRISHSLSDISNHQSKGQSMYVNRKKRSVKWIHDDGHEEERFVEGLLFLNA